MKIHSKDFRAAEDLRLHFFDSIKEFTHPFLAGLTQLDYVRAMAFIARDEPSGETLGIIRIYSDPDPSITGSTG
jgi:acetyltransferase